MIKSSDVLFYLTILKSVSNFYLLNWLSINYKGFYEIQILKYVVNFIKIYIIKKHEILTEKQTNSINWQLVTKVIDCLT